jgi:peptide subunit release factor 1 (eRF1)
MQKTTTARETPLREQLDRLAAFEAVDAPVLSLYLDIRADEQGRPRHEAFLRKAWLERGRALKGDARKSFDRDTERITAYMANELPKTVQGLAMFACAAADGFFDAIQLEAPLDHNWLFVGAVPHIYPLARLNDQYPRYAALLVDTNSARLFVFHLGHAQTTQQVNNVKTRRTSVGGSSQARYQRRVENFHMLHMKEVVEVLDRVVRDEVLNQVVVACDEVAKPLLMEQLPKHLTDKIVDVLKLDINTPGQRVLAETMDALREKDAETDASHVETMLDGWRGNGLAVAGPEETLTALEMGQVEELLITSKDLERMDEKALEQVNEFVTRAQQSAARIRFIEDPELLAEVGGVGALLRFKI